MKQIVISVVSALVTAAALVAGAPAHADPIGNWVAKVNKKLDRTIVFPSNGRSGIVEATFNRRDDGRAEAIVVESADREMKRAARHTLNRIRDLPPLPAGYTGTRIRMQMLIGDMSDLKTYNEQRTRMLASAQATNLRCASLNAPVRLAATAAK